MDRPPDCLDLSAEDMVAVDGRTARMATYEYNRESSLDDTLETGQVLAQGRLHDERSEAEALCCR